MHERRETRGAWGAHNKNSYKRRKQEEFEAKAKQNQHDEHQQFEEYQPQHHAQ